jgi:hypothetical protein
VVVVVRLSMPVPEREEWLRDIRRVCLEEDIIPPTATALVEEEHNQQVVLEVLSLAGKVPGLLGANMPAARRLQIAAGPVVVVIMVEAQVQDFITMAAEDQVLLVLLYHHLLIFIPPHGQELTGKL